MNKTIEQLIEERIVTEKDGYSEDRVSLSAIVTIAKLYANQKLDLASEIIGDFDTSEEKTKILSLKDKM